MDLRMPKIEDARLLVRVDLDDLRRGPRHFPRYRFPVPKPVPFSGTETSNFPVPVSGTTSLGLFPVPLSISRGGGEARVFLPIHIARPSLAARAAAAPPHFR